MCGKELINWEKNYLTGIPKLAFLFSGQFTWQFFLILVNSWQEIVTGIYLETVFNTNLQIIFYENKARLCWGGMSTLLSEDLGLNLWYNLAFFDWMWDGIVFVMGNICGEFELNFWKFGVTFLGNSTWLNKSSWIIWVVLQRTDIWQHLLPLSLLPSVFLHSVLLPSQCPHVINIVFQ